jgi:hypothetical protein
MFVKLTANTKITEVKRSVFRVIDCYKAAAKIDFLTFYYFTAHENPPTDNRHCHNSRVH